MFQAVDKANGRSPPGGERVQRNPLEDAMTTVPTLLTTIIILFAVAALTAWWRERRAAGVHPERTRRGHQQNIVAIGEPIESDESYPATHY